MSYNYYLKIDLFKKTSIWVDNRPFPNLLRAQNYEVHHNVEFGYLGNLCFSRCLKQLCFGIPVPSMPIVLSVIDNCFFMLTNFNHNNILLDFFSESKV